MSELSETPFRVYIDQAPPGTGTDLVCVGSADDGLTRPVDVLDWGVP